MAFWFVVPEKLESILEAKRKRFKKFFPELSALYNLKESGAFLKYYEGLEAVKSLYDSLLKEARSGQYHLVISHSTPWFNLDPKYFQNYIECRAKLKLDIRLLLQESEIARRLQKFQKNYNMKVKILPRGTPLSINTIVVPAKIIFHQLKPPILAIVVENQNLVQLHKELFEIIWRSLPSR